MEDEEKLIKKLRKAYFERHKVYMYQCHGCDNWIDLAVEKCPKCKKNNYYYDNNIDNDMQRLYI